MSSSRLARRAFTVCLIAASPAALAQDYPTRPVRLPVAAAPRGGARNSAPPLSPPPPPHPRPHAGARSM